MGIIVNTSIVRTGSSLLFLNTVNSLKNSINGSLQIQYTMITHITFTPLLYA